MSGEVWERGPDSILSGKAICILDETNYVENVIGKILA